MVNVVPEPSALSAAMRAAVQRHQFLDEREPDAAALVGPAARVLDAMEPLEQPGHLLGGYTDTGVGDGDHGVVGVAAHTASMMVPSRVNFNAFDSRLNITFSHMSRST